MKKAFLVTANVTVTATDNARYDFIANFNGVTSGILFNVFTKSDDFASTFVTESYGDNAEGIAFPLVNVCSTNATTFNFN